MVRQCEAEVRAYILSLRERGAARGTFKTNYYGIRYLYRYTRDPVSWAIASKWSLLGIALHQAIVEQDTGARGAVFKPSPRAERLAISRCIEVLA